MESANKVSGSMTLAEVPVGESRRVISVSGKSRFSRRLMEMGFVPGVSISVVKAGPFGDPIQLRLLGYSVAIRKNEAAAVEVESTAGTFNSEV